MKPKKSKDKFEKSKTETVYLTIEEVAEMIGITLPKKKKVKQNKKKKNEP